MTTNTSRRLWQVKVALHKGSTSSMSFSIRQLSKFIKSYKKHYNDKTKRSYLEWVMLAASEVAKQTFPEEEITSITINDKVKQCLK